MTRNPRKTSGRGGLKKLLILSGLILGTLVAAPYLIEGWLDASLNYEQIRRQTAAAVREHTGLEFQSQGVRFHLFRGIVFNGARFIESKSGGSQRTLVRAETLQLRFSLLDYLRSRPPVHTVLMDSARVDFGNRSALEVWQFFETVLQSPENNPDAAPETVATAAPTVLAEHPQFVARNIQFESSRPGAAGYARFRFDIEAESVPEQSSHVRLRFGARLTGDGRQREEQQSPAHGHGDFAADGSGRLYFFLEDAPLAVVAALIENSALLPPRLTTRLSGDAAPASGLRLAAGRLTGAGSFDVYPRMESGPIGVNFKGHYRDAAGRLYFAGSRLLTVERDSGTMQYNGGFELTGPASHFSLALQSDVRAVNTSQPRYTLKLNDKNLPARDGIAARNRLELEASLNVGPGLRFGGLDAGRLEFDLQLERGRRFRLADSQIRGHDLVAAFATTRPDSGGADSEDSNTNLQRLKIKELEARWAAGNEAGVPPFEGRISGEFLGGSLQLQARGDLQLQPAGDDVAVTVVTDLESEGELAGLPLQQLVAFVRQRYHSTLSATGTDESRRAEDAGPLWQNKFFETPFYRTILEQLRLRASLRLHRAQPAGSLPPELSLRGRVENGYIRVESENGTASLEEPEFQLKYESNWQAFLPRQDLQLRLRIPRNQLSFPELTAHPAPPANLELRYLMGGEGILPGDLMQRTYSRLEIQTDGLTLGRNRMLDIMRHEAGLDGQDLKVEGLDLVRSTDGSESSLRVRASVPDRLFCEASGENLAGIGGQLDLRFRYPGEPGQDRRLRFRVTPDGRYVPEL